MTALAPSSAPALARGEWDFAADVLVGLSAYPKRLPPKYFYDDRGSQLFEAITALPEYYLTRTEIAILEANAGAIVRPFPADAAMVEFGSGSAAKARILLRAAGALAAYVPVDIAAEFLSREAALLNSEFPHLQILPVTADFSQHFDLPPAIRSRPQVGFFPGSTIGNFELHEAAKFLRHTAKLLGSRTTLVVGVDLIKDFDVLRAAYNDAAGVTAAFNLNLLQRINRDVGADFNLDAFRHYAFYNRERRRIEMHLASRVAQRVRVRDRTIEFRRGETIHTENSYKYTVESFQALAAGAGWSPAAVWVDSDRYFSVHALLSA